METVYLTKGITATFNTGRHYSKEGQVIEATLIFTKPCPIFPEWNKVSVVKFHDKTRNVSGVMEIDSDYDTVTTRKVLEAYDGGRYTLS